MKTIHQTSAWVLSCFSLGVSSAAGVFDLVIYFASLIGLLACPAFTENPLNIEYFTLCLGHHSFENVKNDNFNNGFLIYFII